MFHCRIASVCLPTCLALSVACGGARAQDEVLRYTVLAGDTLSGIAQRHFVAGANLEELRGLNQLASLDLIHPGQVLSIPRHMVRSLAAQAQVATLHCPPGGVDVTPDGHLRVGDRLQEGQTIEVPKPCHLALSLPDQALVRLAPGSTLHILELRRYSLAAEHSIRLEVRSGLVHMSVEGSAPRRQALQVLTPKAMAGVRGTEFRVIYEAATGLSKVEVAKGRVNTRGSADSAGTDLAAGFGAVIEADGRHRGAEELLQAPGLRKLGRVATNASQLRLELAPVTGATAYSIESTPVLTPFGGEAQGLFQEAVIHLPQAEWTPTAQFYRVSAVSASGLTGAPADWAICADTGAMPSPRCMVRFALPDPGPDPARLTLEPLDADKDSTWDQSIPSGASRFVVAGLRAGAYRWQADYPQADQAGTPSSPRRFSGSFTVRTVRTD